MPGSVIVQFRADTPAARVAAIAAAVDARIEKHLGQPEMVLMRATGDDDASALISRLRRYPEVQHAEPNRLIRLRPPDQP